MGTRKFQKPLIHSSMVYLSDKPTTVHIYSLVKLKLGLKGECFTTMGEIQEETQEDLNMVTMDDNGCFQEREKCWDMYLKEIHFEGFQKY